MLVFLRFINIYELDRQGKMFLLCIFKQLYVSFIHVFKHLEQILYSVHSKQILLSKFEVMDNLRLLNDSACSTTGKPTRSFATERVSLDSV